MTTSIKTVDLTISSLDLSASKVEAQTVAAYDRLAPEYDSEEHATTRKLERLSNDVCASLLRSDSSAMNVHRVLEVGCGTGALSQLLLQIFGNDTEFVFTDASAMMLRLVQAKLKGLDKLQSIKYIQSAIVTDQTLSDLGRFDLIVCGMGDPYFFDPAIDNIRRCCEQTGHLLVTLPEKSWAIAERQYRLKVPVNQTRFRLLSGEVVVPFSFIYSEQELSQLLRKHNFEVREFEIRSESSAYQAEHKNTGHLLPVSVIGALARAV